MNSDPHNPAQPPVPEVKRLPGGTGRRTRHAAALFLLASFLLETWTTSLAAALQTRELRVFAAASASPPVEEAARLYSEREGLEIHVSTASSAVLARQIASGAPADVFIPASEEWMEYLRERGLVVPATLRILVENRLALISPAAHPFAARIEPEAPLASAFQGCLAVADPDHVPLGIYTREALVHLGLWDRLRERMVPALDARAALLLVERGECGAGIVYLSDARTSRRVVIVDLFPAETHRPIRYPAAAVRGRRVAEAAAFLDFLSSEAGRLVFARHGFGPAGGAAGAAPTDLGFEGPPLTPEKRPGSRPLLHREDWGAFFLSLQVASAATLAGLPLGIALGWLFARKSFRGKLLLEAAVMLPLILPPVVTGYLLLLALGRSSPAGRLFDALGIPFAFSWRGAAVAACAVGLPLLVRSVRTSVETVDPGLEAAARTLGAGPWRVFRTVTLPLAWPGVLAGSLLAFARGLGEFGATIVVAGNIAGETRTLPLAIFTRVQAPGGEGAALPLVVLSILLSVGAVAASEALARRARRRIAGERSRA